MYEENELFSCSEHDLFIFTTVKSILTSSFKSIFCTCGTSANSLKRSNPLKCKEFSIFQPFWIYSQHEYYFSRFWVDVNQFCNRFCSLNQFMAARSFKDIPSSSYIFILHVNARKNATKIFSHANCNDTAVVSIASSIANDKFHSKVDMNCKHLCIDKMDKMDKMCRLQMETGFGHK